MLNCRSLILRSFLPSPKYQHCILGTKIMLIPECINRNNTAAVNNCIISIYQTSEYPFLHTLIGYSSSKYPVISTGLQNKMDACASITFTAKFCADKIHVFVTGYSLVWYILKQYYSTQCW